MARARGRVQAGCSFPARKEDIGNDAPSPFTAESRVDAYRSRPRRMSGGRANALRVVKWRMAALSFLPSIRSFPRVRRIGPEWKALALRDGRGSGGTFPLRMWFAPSHTAWDAHEEDLGERTTLSSRERASGRLPCPLSGGRPPAARGRWPRPWPDSRRRWDAGDRRCRSRAAGDPDAWGRASPDRNRPPRRTRRNHGSTH